MFGRRLKPQCGAAKEAGTVIVGQAVPPDQVLTAKADVVAARKPSERFMRRPLKAKSRASRSERLRVEDLVDRLQDTAGKNGVLNGVMKLKCYRPGAERPPG